MWFALPCGNRWQRPLDACAIAPHYFKVYDASPISCPFGINEQRRARRGGCSCWLSADARGAGGGCGNHKRWLRGDLLCATKELAFAFIHRTPIARSQRPCEPARFHHRKIVLVPSHS